MKRKTDGRFILFLVFVC